MIFLLLISASALQAVNPSETLLKRSPFNIRVDHPVGVEASTLARSIKRGNLAVPYIYDGEILIMGAVVSVGRHDTDRAVVLTTIGSSDHLTAYVLPDPHLVVGSFVGIACHKADGTETTAEVSECKLISAPGMPAFSMTVTPVG